MTANRRSWIYVVAQFISAAALVLAVRVEAATSTSIVVILAGVVLGISAIASIRLSQLSVLPEIRNQASLVTTGPYRWIRHPMYTGLMLLTAGCVSSPLDSWKLPVWLVLVAVLWGKSTYEEGLLCQRFPEYEEYRRRTKRFIPWFI